MVHVILPQGRQIITNLVCFCHTFIINVLSGSVKQNNLCLKIRRLQSPDHLLEDEDDLCENLNLGLWFGRHINFSNSIFSHGSLFI